jgi:hypothetical protein
VTSCIVDSAAIYIRVVKFRNTIFPPPLQLSLHTRAALSSNSNGTRSVYNIKTQKSSLYCEMSMHWMRIRNRMWWYTWTPGRESCWGSPGDRSWCPPAHRCTSAGPAPAHTTHNALIPTTEWGKQRILFLTDIRPVRYPANPKRRISGWIFGVTTIFLVKYQIYKQA